MTTSQYVQNAIFGVKRAQTGPAGTINTLFIIRIRNDKKLRIQHGNLQSNSPTLPF